MRHGKSLRLVMTLRISLFALVMVGFIGCARLNSIYRSENLDKDSAHIVSIDSKQRVVLTNPSSKQSTVTTTTTTDLGSNSNGGKTATGASQTKTVQTQTDETVLRFCAEPPPDVFTALASSLGAEVSLSKSATLDTAIATKLAATLSENAATIERTQTVNILREVMYRNCERYLSGAINREEFIVQAARDQQLIVQVLAVEQITGVARAQSTALTTVAKAAVNGVTDTGLETLSNARKDHETKRVASDKAIKEATDLPPNGACGTTLIDVGNLPNGVTTDQANAKNTQCDAAKVAINLAKEAATYLSVVQEAVAKQGSVNSKTQGQLASAAQTASEASVAIADRVVEIVKQYQAFDEIGMTCVVQARLTGALPSYCNNLIQQMADTRSAELLLVEEQARLKAEQIKAYRTEMDIESSGYAQEVWKFLGKNPTIEDLKILANKAGKNIPDVHMKSLANVDGDFRKFARAFVKMGSDLQEALAKAATLPK